EQIREARFREDLFYRLNVISFDMPPLRHRKEDVPLLASHFLQKSCEKMEKGIKRLTPGVMNILESYHWPGNVRELENIIERVVAIEERETITEECLPLNVSSIQRHPDSVYTIKPGFKMNDALDEITRNFVQEALLVSSGNLKDAASYLGITYRSLRYLIDKFGLKDWKGARRNH
ncbi:MAG: helix-turn-helix domain-containing protein, partial [Candidatus Aminicenantes bacterium]